MRKAEWQQKQRTTERKNINNTPLLSTCWLPISPNRFIHFFSLFISLRLSLSLSLSFCFSSGEICKWDVITKKWRLKVNVDFFSQLRKREKARLRIGSFDRRILMRFDWCQTSLCLLPSSTFIDFFFHRFFINRRATTKREKEGEEEIHWQKLLTARTKEEKCDLDSFSAEYEKSSNKKKSFIRLHYTWINLS